MRLIIKALDTLFFGDGRPFTMGDDSWSSDIFPPYPSTIYGMMRGVYFKENMSEFAKADTPDDPTNNLEIDYFGVSLERNEDKTEIFPLPLDVVKNETHKTFVNLELGEVKGIFSKYSLSHQLLPPQNMKADKIRNTDTTYYLTAKGLNSYLEGKTIAYEQELIKLNNYISLEPKIGISRDRYDTENKKLYRINQTRPESTEGSLHFIIDYQKLEVKEKSFYSRLGGEAKLVLLEKHEEDSLKFTIDSTDTIIKMYLASPAIYESGWKPSFGKFDKEIEVIACAMGKQLHIGGWNAKTKQPRPMYKAVPAGSVYFLKGDKEIIKGLIDTYHGKKIPQENDYAKQGFGLVYFGHINQNANNTTDNK